VTASAVKPRVTVRAARHLKWPALDPLERLLMIVCALLLLGFTVVERSPTSSAAI
jgi:hypothetical protein